MEIKNQNKMEQYYAMFIKLVPLSQDPIPRLVMIFSLLLLR